jgi:hypothetical protein
MSGQPHESAGRPDLTALENALSLLAPARPALDRDQVLFRAGQAAGPRRWFWPAATAVSTTTALVLAVLLACRPAPTVVQRIVHVPVEQPVPGPQPPVPDGPATTTEETSVPPQARTPGSQLPYLRLLKHLQRWELDGLGQPPPPPPANPFIPPLSLSPGDSTP